MVIEMRLANQNNSFNQAPARPAVPGRIIENVQRYRLPSGKIRKVRTLIRTIMDQNSIYRTRQVIDVEPPLDCSCIPDNPSHIVECTRCGSVVCQRHSSTCMVCGNVFCTGCLKRITVNGISAIVCRDCALDIKSSKLLKLLIHFFWGE